MMKNFISKHSNLLLSLCTLAVIASYRSCHIIFHDNIPPNDLEQWLSNKHKHHD